MTSKWLICLFCLSFVVCLILMAKDRQTWHLSDKSQTKVRNLPMLISVCLSEFRVYKIIAKRLKLKILNTQRRQAIFFYTAHKVLLTPPPLFIFIFPTPPQFYYFPPPPWIPSFSTILIFSNLLLNLDFPPPQFLLFFLDPTSTLDSTCFFQHSFVNSETIHNHHHISIVSLHHHHISIVFTPPIVFLPAKIANSHNLAKKVSRLYFEHIIDSTCECSAVGTHSPRDTGKCVSVLVLSWWRFLFLLWNNEYSLNFFLN